MKAAGPLVYSWRFNSKPSCMQVGVSYGYLVPHPESSLVVGICVLAYFLFSSLLTLYIMYYDPMYLFQAKV